MRVTVCGPARVSRSLVYETLDQLHHDKGPLTVVAWIGHRVGSIALDWANSRPGAGAVAIGSVVRLRGGLHFHTRAAVRTLFTVYRPDVLLSFGVDGSNGGSMGEFYAAAARYDVPVELISSKTEKKSA